MCSSENELIHDVRQVHLEELIMKNEEQFVMVRFPMTDRQKDDLLLHDIAPDDVLEAVTNIGTPILPCEDVEPFYALIGGGSTAYVRRTDMEAQVAKVAAEKDVEIARLSDALKGMIEIATSRASVQTVETAVSERTSVLRDAIVNAACDLADGVDASTVCRNLRAALHKGSAA